MFAHDLNELPLSLTRRLQAVQPETDFPAFHRRILLHELSFDNKCQVRVKLRLEIRQQLPFVPPLAVLDHGENDGIAFRVVRYEINHIVALHSHSTQSVTMRHTVHGPVHT